MSLYLRPSGSRGVAVALCARCGFKFYHDELVQEPVTERWVCKDCCDEKDPWLLPQRGADQVTLAHPRPDETLDVPQGD